MTYSVRFFNYGYQIYPASAVMHGKGYDQWVRVEMFMFLLSGVGKHILIDAGMSQTHADSSNPMITKNLGEKGRFVIERDPIPTLYALWQINPHQIDAIIVTHFHLDHVCNLPYFPKSKLYISRRGWATVAAPKHVEMVPPVVVPREVVEYIVGPANSRVVFVEDQQEIFPGIEVIYTSGHTLDQQVVKVTTEKAVLFFPSDNIPLFRNLEEHTPCGSPADMVKAYDVLKMAESKGWTTIVPHDPRLTEIYPTGVIPC